MAAPSIVARYIYTPVTSGAANATVSSNAKPVEAVAGRLCIFYLNSADGVVGSCAPDAGFGLTDHVNNYTTNGTSAAHTYIGSKVLTGNEPWPLNFTINGNGADDQLILEIYPSGCTVGAVVTSSTGKVTNFTTPALVTTGNESLVHFSVGAKNGSALSATPTSTYPTGTTGISVGRSRANSSGVIFGAASKVYSTAGTNTDNELGAGAGTTAKTWNALTTTIQDGQTSAIEIKAAAASILSIGTAGTVTMDDGTGLISNPISVSGFSSPISVTLSTTSHGTRTASGIVLSSGSGSFVFPLWFDTGKFPFLGSVTVTVSDGSVSSNTTATLANSSGYLDQLLSGVVTSDPTYFGYWMANAPISRPLVDMDRIYWPYINGVIFDSDSAARATSATDLTVFVHRYSGTNVDNIEAYNVHITEAGNIVSAISLTSRSSASRFLTFRNLTKRSLA